SAFPEQRGDKRLANPAATEPLVHGDLVNEHLLPLRPELGELGSPERPDRFAPFIGGQENIPLVREEGARRRQFGRLLQQVSPPQDIQLRTGTEASDTHRGPHEPSILGLWGPGAVAPLRDSGCDGAQRTRPAPHTNKCAGVRTAGGRRVRRSVPRYVLYPGLSPALEPSPIL